MRLPIVMTRDEVSRVLARLGGLHRLIAMLLYGRLAAPLREQIAHAAELHHVDLDEAFGAVWLAYALDRKYPAAAREWSWQYVSPASLRSPDPRDGIERRHHLSDQALQRATSAPSRSCSVTQTSAPR